MIGILLYVWIYWAYKFRMENWVAGLIILIQSSILYFGRSEIRQYRFTETSLLFGFDRGEF